MRRIIFQPKIDVIFPEEVIINKWGIKEGTLKVEFEVPYLLKGELEAKIYWEQQEGEIYEGEVKIEYDYQSQHSWKWNDFTFYFDQAEELAQIWTKILNLTVLEEEMEYRKEPPQEASSTFKDGYGSEIVEDIKKAIAQLRKNKIGILLVQTG